MLRMARASACSSIHDSRLDRAVLVAIKLFAFAERLIEAGVVLRSEDERSGRKY